MQIYWRHEKGGVYRIVDFVVDESTCTPVVVYQEVNKDDFQDVMGHRWVRPCSVFFSGKFSQLRFDSEEDFPKEGDNFRRIGEILPTTADMVRGLTQASKALQGRPVEYPDFPDETFQGGQGE